MGRYRDPFMLTLAQAKIPITYPAGLPKKSGAFLTRPPGKCLVEHRDDLIDASTCLRTGSPGHIAAFLQVFIRQVQSRQDCYLQSVCRAGGFSYFVHSFINNRCQTGEVGGVALASQVIGSTVNRYACRTCILISGLCQFPILRARATDPATARSSLPRLLDHLLKHAVNPMNSALPFLTEGTPDSFVFRHSGTKSSAPSCRSGLSGGLRGPTGSSSCQRPCRFSP